MNFLFIIFHQCLQQLQQYVFSVTELMDYCESSQLHCQFGLLRVKLILLYFTQKEKFAADFTTDETSS